MTPNTYLFGDNKNSTSITLGIDGEWVGEAVEMIYGGVITAVFTDQTGTLFMEQSVDGITWDSSVAFDIEANKNEIHRLTATRKFYRTRYVNNGVAQTEFRLQTSYGDPQLLSSPLNSTVDGDADAIITNAFPMELDITSGRYSNWEMISKFGTNLAVSTALEDVWNVGGVLDHPTSAETLEILSSSAADTSGGLGAMKVLVSGLDANFVCLNEEVTMDGTTPVTLSSAFIRVYRLRVTESGTYGGANLGTITLRVSGGGATRAQIDFDTQFGGLGTSEMTHFTVPAGRVGLVTYFRYNIQSSASVDLFVSVRQNADDVTTPFTGQHFARIRVKAAIGTETFMYQYPLVVQHC